METNLRTVETEVRRHIDAAIDALTKALPPIDEIVPPRDPRYEVVYRGRRTCKELLDARAQLDAMARGLR